jgi:Ca-activated chloride channel family protein
VFTLGLLVVFSPLRAQETGRELSPEVISRMNELQKGELNQIEKLKLADDLYRSGAKNEALELYDENLPEKISNQIPPEAYMNFGTALLEKGEVEISLELYRTLSDSMDKSEYSEKLRKMMDKNVVSFFKQQEQKKKDQQKKDQEKNQDQKKNDQNNKSSQGQQNKDQNKDGSGNQKKKDQKNGQNDQNKDPQNDQQNKGRKDKDQDKKDEDENQDQSDQKNDDQGRKKKMPPQKIPAKLKQLMSDDRQLQMKMIENGTRDLNRKKSRKSKDW